MATCGTDLQFQEAALFSTSCTRREATRVVDSNCLALAPVGYTAIGDTPWQPKASLKLFGR
jgi:hypothetical protein